MTQYFNLERSLIFLNKDRSEEEYLIPSDLFLYCSKNKISPCFFLKAGYGALWEETNKKGNYGKIYDIFHYKSGYLTFGRIEDAIFLANSNGYQSFWARWVKELDVPISEIPTYIDYFRIYTNEDAIKLEDRYRKSEPESDNGFLNYSDYLYHRVEGVEINFSDIHFSKDQLVLIKNSLITDHQLRVTPLEYKGKRGISQAKVNAKLAAQTLADYLWRQDREHKIRIKEMAINVHAELYQTDHANQLPDKAESLESWIKDIASKYPHSRQGGRPKNG